jgi:hypothetical protein
MSWLDDMSPDEYFKRMAAAQKGESSGPIPGAGIKGGVPVDPAQLKKAIETYTKQIKGTLQPQQAFEDALKGQKQALVDVTKDIDDLNKQIDESLERGDLEAAQAQRQMRDAVAHSAANRNLKASAINLGIGLTTATATLVGGIATFTKGLLTNQGGVELAGQLAGTTARATGEAVSSLGSTMSVAGSAVSMFATSAPGWVKLIAKAFELIGPIIEKFGLKAAQLAEEGMQILTNEVVKTRDSFMKLSASGVMFAGGMMEMRQTAGKAGLTLEQMTNAATKNTESLSGMGLGLSQATKRMAGITGELRRSDMGDQLQKLGYSFEDMAGLSAQTAANLNAAGKLRSMSDAEVAKVTVQYGRDLKTLQAITGEDAKKKMEEARTRAMEADLMAQTLAKGGPEAALKLQQQLATMPDSLKKGYMEFVSTGGTAIADAATNVAIVQNPKIMEQYKTQLNTLGDINKTASDAFNETKNLNVQTVQYAKDNVTGMQAIATTARLTGDSLTTAATAIANDLLANSTKWTESAVASSNEAADKVKNSTEPLTTSILDLEKKTQDLKVATEQAMNGMLPLYTKHLTSLVDTIGKVVEKLNAAMEKIKADDAAKNEEDDQSFWNQYGKDLLKVVGGAALTIGAGAVGAFTFGLAAPLSAAMGIAGTGLMADAAVSQIEKATKEPKTTAKPPESKIPEAPKPKMALGGIATTASIFGEAGPEAAVPLPDGRTIPVTLKIKDNAPKSVAGMMADMKNKPIPAPQVGRAINRSSNGLDSSPNFGSTKLSKEVSEAYTKLITEMKTDNTPLIDGLSGMSKILENQTAVTASTDQTMKELVGLIKAQLSKHDEMINELKNSVTINQRMLNHAYS